jgi:hypothetical protein
MKKLGIILIAGCSLVLFQCGQSTTSGEQDSLSAATDLTESEYFISTPNAAFSFQSPKEEGDDALFEAFRLAYQEAITERDSVISYEFFHGNIFSAGSCVNHTVLELRSIGPEVNSLFVQWYILEEMNPGWYAVYEPILEDITEFQDETSANMSLENQLNECPVFSVTYKTEGGDIDFRSREVITFYSVEAGFKEILKIELDLTEDQDGYVDGDPDGDETFERRDFTILTSKTNGLFDIQVDYDNGSEKKSEIYAWNGSVYSLKLD